MKEAKKKQGQTKGEAENGDDSSAGEEELEKLVDYKLQMDFSRLAHTLKRNKKAIKTNTQEISALRVAMQRFRETYDTSQRNVQEQHVNTEKTSVHHRADRLAHAFKPYTEAWRPRNIA